jgi:hypothetical protein
MRLYCQDDFVTFSRSRAQDMLQYLPQRELLRV